MVRSVALSVEAMPHLLDHCLFPQAPGWSELSDRYPVVPMTLLLELMGEAARELAPGKVVVGFEQVRARRWLAVEPPVEIAVTASAGADGAVAVSIDGYAETTVRLADAYPPPPEPSSEPLAAERPAVLAASQLYDEGWLFHGPAYQGVVGVGPIGLDGIRGTLVSLPTPGALLDAAGQLAGYWVMATTAANRVNLPVRVGSVRFSGPPPAAGERVEATVWVRDTADTSVRVDMELRTTGGRVWARVDAWENRRFDGDDLIFSLMRSPGTEALAEPQAGGWFLVRERARDLASRELLMRRYLGATEREAYQRLGPRTRRQWLLGRIAIKDAARRLRWSRGEGPRYPAELGVRNDARGRPEVTGHPAEPFDVSLAHTDGLAAAIVRPRGDGVGIDIERIEDRDARLEALALTEGERALLDRLSPDAGSRAEWLTRIWAAKEAVAKAEGTGLGGRPKRFVVERVTGDRLLVAVEAAGGDGDEPALVWVETALIDDVLEGRPARYVVAWTTPGPAEPPTTTAGEDGNGH